MRADPILYSPAWRSLRRVALARDGYRCTVCRADVSAPGAARIDHIRPRNTHPHLALTLANTRTLCPRCDNRAHPEKGGRPYNRIRPPIDRLNPHGIDAHGWPDARPVSKGRL